MAFGGETPRSKWVMRAGLALTLAVLFAAAAIVAEWHGHTHVPDACVVCHAGHLFGLAETPNPGLAAPEFVCWTGPAAEILAAPQAFPELTRSRAPPA
jgi:hypothetical protein